MFICRWKLPDGLGRLITIDTGNLYPSAVPDLARAGRSVEEISKKSPGVNYYGLYWSVLWTIIRSFAGRWASQRTV